MSTGSKNENVANERGRAVGLAATAALAIALSGCDGATKPEGDVLTATPAHNLQTRDTLQTSPSQLQPTQAMDVPVAEPRTPPTPAEAREAWVAGNALYEARDYASAVDRLRVASIGRPDDRRVLYLLGLAEWKTGHLEAADVALSRATELEPGMVRGWINLARVRMDRSDPDGALASAERALALEPASTDGLHQRGRALAALGRTDESLEVLRLAHEASPSHGQVANTYGFVLLQSGRTGEAVAPLEVARELLPDVAYVRNNLGLAYERTGRRDEAIAEFQAAATLDGPSGKAAASLARLGVPVVPESEPQVVTAESREGVSDSGTR